MDAFESAGSRDAEDADGPTTPDRDERLDPRVRWLWIGRAAIPAAVLGGVGIGAGLFLDRGPLAGLGIGLLAFVLGSLHAVYRFRAFRYRLAADALTIDRGVLTKVNTVVPYVRVQHVDTQRSPIERLLGLSRVVVYTAGSRGADVSIPGLLPDRARRLQDRLRTLAEDAGSDDAV